LGGCFCAAKIDVRYKKIKGKDARLKSRRPLQIQNPAYFLALSLAALR
jgi:hypothetical protein